jgi:hypothetical protein
MKFSFVGCSYTAGFGLGPTDLDYATIVSQHYNAKMTNLSVSANSNYKIFISSLNELLFNKPDILFVQWTGSYRLWVAPYPNIELFVSFNDFEGIDVGHLRYSKNEIKKLAETTHMLNHDYNHLLTLINYCNLLERASISTKIIFINGLIPWSEDVFNPSVLTDMYNVSDLVKNLFEFENSSDKDIKLRFDILKTAVDGLNKSLWVNMFNSLSGMMTDSSTWSADHLGPAYHPGPQSHREYARMIINYLGELK